LQKKSCGGKIPVHVNVDEKRGLIYVSNWGSGDLCVLRLNKDGSIGDVVYEEAFSYGSGIKPVQNASHVHDAYPRDNGKVRIDRTKI